MGCGASAAPKPEGENVEVEQKSAGRSSITVGDQVYTVYQCKYCKEAFHTAELCREHEKVLCSKRPDAKNTGDDAEGEKSAPTGQLTKPTMALGHNPRSPRRASIDGDVPPPVGARPISPRGSVLVSPRGGYAGNNLEAPQGGGRINSKTLEIDPELQRQYREANSPRPEGNKDESYRLSPRGMPALKMEPPPFSDMKGGHQRASPRLSPRGSAANVKPDLVKISPRRASTQAAGIEPSPMDRPMLHHASTAE